MRIRARNKVARNGRHALRQLRRDAYAKLEQSLRSLNRSARCVVERLDKCVSGMMRLRSGSEIGNRCVLRGWRERRVRHEAFERILGELGRAKTVLFSR